VHRQQHVLHHIFHHVLRPDPAPGHGSSEGSNGLQEVAIGAGVTPLSRGEKLAPAFFSSDAAAVRQTVLRPACNLKGRAAEIGFEK
jgi:hypothetical protein